VCFTQLNVMHNIEDLIAKYNTNIPRYTSFPTVPDWKNNITQQIWVENFAQNLTKPISLYIHIPFCHKLCTFCACNKFVTDNYDNAVQYIDALEREILAYKNQIGFEKIKVTQFHIGGGTPTFLKPKEMGQMFLMLEKYFTFDNGGEKSIEAHPEFTTTQQITVLKEYGFNRISFGVQDFTPEVQEIINRKQSYENIKMLCNFAKNIGFNSVNLDFIYGLPLQNANSITQTIAGVREIMPERIAFYGYAHVPWKDGTLQRKFSDNDLPSPTERLHLFIQGKEGFEKIGYKAIGMDHFALPNDELYTSYANGTLHRNFMGYTVQYSNTLLGIGVSAISETSNAYKQNTKNLSEYYRNQTAIETGHLLTREEMTQKTKILEIMTQFQTTTQTLTPNLQTMLEDGLITFQNESIVVTEIGKIFVRNIASEFDMHRASKTSKQFSQSV
jgi:oxygen-independent coproporphyrinogen-3 oxidase